MCRHIAYLGPPVPVGDILTRGPHSLRTQSWAPRDMRGGGTINADGFGVAWWTPAPAAGRLRASRYRNAAPIWTDPAVDEVLPQLHSSAVLAAVRSATVGLPVEQAACAPFTHGRWAFSHNGAIPDWRDALTAVAAQFDSPSLLDSESLTDSALLWVILRSLLENKSPPSGADTEPEVALTAAMRTAFDPEIALTAVVRAVFERSPRARLNLLLGDGETVWATTWQHALSVLVADDFAVVASEPYDDDPRWQSIDDRQVVVVRPGRLSVKTLDFENGRTSR
ncbi:MAG: Gamma-glutamyl-hercynylcysteine sulfoxide hydrolase [Nocardia sp.]|uniref:ergothioneine biosynthesis protein EgtC n=1 Tax=Nocardia sp. TaxID=1821 RepID=UPI0026254B9A|nr:ergothioneine biosynthesis protein EgtC [Nocardia sp.]MCU1648450.1 Gamma-glutamyl-hercynylcysteine sulfoxide hydrolase [Nocardia sp.]